MPLSAGFGAHYLEKVSRGSKQRRIVIEFMGGVVEASDRPHHGGSAIFLSTVMAGER